MISSAKSTVKYVKELQAISCTCAWPGYGAFMSATGGNTPLSKRFITPFLGKNPGIKLLGIGSGGSRNRSNTEVLSETLS